MREQNPYEVPTEASGQVHVKPQRDKPLTATLFGVIHIVMGATGLFMTIIALVMQAITSLGGIPQPDLPAVLNSPTMHALQWINGLMSVVLCILLVIAGVGLLTMKKWGRTLSNYWAALIIMTTLISLAIQLSVLGGPVMQAAQDFDARNQEEMVIVISFLGGLVGSCIAFVYPILVLVFMNRSGFVEALNNHKPLR